MSQFQILGRRPFPFKAIPIRFAYTNFPDTILRLLPRLAALAVHQLALERLEERFRERVIPWVAWPRHGLGDTVGLETSA